MKLGIALSLVVFVLIFNLDNLNIEQEQYDRYCRMVEMYKQSNGENGWPAYKGECK